MPLNWPSLPTPESAGYSDSIRDNTVRSAADMGPESVRPRFTGVTRDVQFTLRLSGAQLAALEDFYITTAVHGSLPFQFPNPRTGQNVNARFAAPLKPSIHAGDLWIVSVSLVFLP